MRALHRAAQVRGLVRLAFLLAAGAAAAANFPATVRVELPAPGAGVPARADLLGNNLEWSNHGDGMLQAGTTDFHPAMLKAAQRLSPPILRYPGGTLSDVYRWRSGLGSRGNRGTSPTLGPVTSDGPTTQTVLMGTAEFLELCTQLGARPLITVNVITGTAQEAAEWVRQTNVTGLKARASGATLPRVDLWEIGNEPYLRNADKPPDRDIAPAEFAAKVNEYIAAMKAVDPSIKIIVPFRNATWGGIPVTPFPDFNPVLFATLRHDVDYVAIHNAYAPALLQPRGALTDEAIFRATMAATRAVSADLAATQAALDAQPHLARAGMAVTEYGPFFSIGQGDTDTYVSTLAGALYTADVLRVFATTPNVAMAQFWSLAGNWHFGSFDPNDPHGNPRASYWSLYAVRKLLHGVLAPATVDGPTFDSPAAGLVPAYEGTPTVAALATLADATLRVLVINKDIAATAELTLEVATDRAPAGAVNCFTVSGPTPFAHAKEISVKSGTFAATAFPLRLTLAPHAFVLLEVPLK